LESHKTPQPRTKAQLRNACSLIRITWCRRYPAWCQT